jgi:hypothetical protein
LSLVPSALWLSVPRRTAPWIEWSGPSASGSRDGQPRPRSSFALACGCPSRSTRDFNRRPKPTTTRSSRAPS